ncbi:MAG: plasmid maintenance system killer protein [Acidobacteria bacterium RBG_16_68_9]|nr:MAG: plasmid maintenance system killer protein [Acidobacteria bacterium RBG_16_68_9]
MIVSFADKVTEALYHGEPRKLLARAPADIRETAVRTLDMLNAARHLADLRSPLGNRLEALKGGLRGLHSIRINDQWRVIFRWADGDAHDVRIADYH